MRYLEIKTLLEIADRVKQQLRDRFKQNDPNLTDAQINYYLDRWDRFAPSFAPEYRDITRLSFAQVEQLIDNAQTRSELKGKAQPEQTFDQNDDLIYDQNGLTIMRGDMREKCIRYGRGYSWCISRQDASNMFYTYRMRKDEPVFYFVFDKNKPQDDVWHAVVIYVDKYRNYYVATANNPGDEQMDWNEILRYQPRLKGLESLFKSQPLTAEEKSDWKKFGQEVDEETYEQFNLRDKYKYIQFGHQLSRDQESATPQELIGTYAKRMPLSLSKQTLSRLNSSDLKYVEAERIKIVNQDPDLISDINAPSEAVQMAAVQADPRVIIYMSNPAESVQKYAVEQDIWVFPEISNASPAVQEYAVKRMPYFITHAKNQQVIDRMLLPSTLAVIKDEGTQTLKSWFEHLDQEFVPSALYSPEFYTALLKKHGQAVLMSVLHNISLHRGTQYAPLLDQWETQYPNYTEQIAYVKKRL